MKKDGFTLKSYIDNPFGKSMGSIAGNQNAIKENYMNQMLAIESMIAIKWYMIKDKTFIAHIKIPSSNEKSSQKIFYDVIFEFDISNLTNEVSINNLPLKVYSNCPSFTFTYARVFWDSNLVPKWIKGKFNKAVFKHNPSERNVNKMIGYEKSLYMSGLFLLRNQRNMITVIKSMAMQLSNYSVILTDTKSSDEIMEEINQTKQKKPGVDHIDTSKVSSSRRNEAMIQLKTGNKVTPFTKMTKKVKSIGKVKKTIKR